MRGTSSFLFFWPRADPSHTKDAEEYGFFGLKDEETTWMGDVKLEAPALNISGFYYDPMSPIYGAEWEDPRDGAGQPFKNKDNAQWVAGDEMYDVPYMREYGRCQPASDVSPPGSPRWRHARY